MFNGAKRRAKKLGLAFTIVLDDIHIPELCPVFLVPIEVGGGELAPELDRIRNHLGYIPGNVIVVSRRANRLKSDSTIDELARIVELYRTVM